MEWLKDVAPEITILGALTLIQIAPIKINPWSWILKLLRKAIGTYDIYKRMDELERDLARTRSKVIRKEIIDFAEELRRGKSFHLAEFEEMGRLINEYRKLIEKHKFKNAYCEAQMSYIEDQMTERGYPSDEISEEQ